ncbi:RusA family crossover junction endodeoxyribonuclease [Ectopseudomonas khazarica]|uniref:RusA family crossover junction endodeoxyribonuclease n=1 Tax=Ectopseudomonas khazarica TaxID=2502979 RepID=UPI001AEF85A9|nr:RusA family crossover junction endodeoxyribonuclease [Pseudomonas khazarica]QTS87312.1 RusA family crossover junction endodeoxyribonuclease [Pseudomonas khazarica]
MVKLTLHTRNCDPTSLYKLEELANSELELRLEFDRIVSIQSQKTARDELCAAIQEQLRSFEWICAGPVNLELLWYLHGTQRQETDKVGDIDNITKPIIDSLTGEGGATD